MKTNENERVFFRHLRGPQTKNDSTEKGYGTLCVIYNKDTGLFGVGASVVSKKDIPSYSREAGRIISSGRAKSSSNVPTVSQVFNSFSSHNMAHKNNETGEIVFRPHGTKRTDFFADNWANVQESLRNFYLHIKSFIDSRKAVIETTTETTTETVTETPTNE